MIIAMIMKFLSGVLDVKEPKTKNKNKKEKKINFLLLGIIQECENGAWQKTKVKVKEMFA